MNPKKKAEPKNRGFTLVEALVGTALFAVVFMGIFAAYRLSLKVVVSVKNKITATAIANSHMEIVRNLGYESVGTIGAALPDVEGILEPVETKIINNTVFTVATRVRYVIDPADGTGTADDCDWDYKKVDVTVSWGESAQVNFSTDVAPKTLVQEIQTCLDQPGGVLSVTVFDSSGIAVPSPTIKIYDETGTDLIDSAIPSSGQHAFALSVGTYRVDVSKNSYSGARTYSTTEVAVPDNPNPMVLDGDLTPLSLCIDPAAALSIDGISPTGQDYFADSFDDGLHISDIDDAQVVSSSLVLSGPGYPAAGYALSEAVAPADIVEWDELIFTENVPAGTDISYQLFYYDGLDWVLVPDLDLAGNGAGFSESPVDISGVDKDVYSQLKIKANLTTSDSNYTPAVLGWELAWITSSGAPVGGADFYLQGNKTIGEDDLGQPVYKYAQTYSLDGAGHLDIDNTDEDAYIFSTSATSSFSLIGTTPSPQPVSAERGQTTEVKLYLQSQNFLLVTIEDDLTLEPVFSATVNLYNNALGYNQTQYTNAEGQTYFAPLDDGDYDISISAAGYDVYSESVTIAGGGTEIYSIHHQE